MSSRSIGRRWLAPLLVTSVALGLLWSGFYLGSHVVGRHIHRQEEGSVRLDIYKSVGGYFVQVSRGRVYYISAVGEKCCVYYLNGHFFLAGYMFDFDEDGEGNLDCPALGGEWGDWSPNVVFKYDYFEFTDYEGKRHRVRTPS